jgi:putative FmdB family regulatory protein
MPLYEFQCTECDSAFEELVRASSAIPDIQCPQCGSTDVRRKVSTFASKISGGGAAAPARQACAPGGT